MPAVSVIIPTYNHREYVLQTLESVFAQTFTDYEVIVVNDGSPDDTAEVLRPLVEAGRIRYVEQANGGQASARNRGLSEARGEFIGLLDDDDLWPADKLEWQVGRLRSEGALWGVAGACVDVGAEGAAWKSECREPVVAEFEQLFYGCPIASPGQTLVRASALRTVGGFNEGVWGADDYDLWFKIARLGRLELHQRVALYYRRHGLNASRSFLRMLGNGTRVVETHLRHVPRRRRLSCRRVAYRFLYDYVGAKAVKELKRRACVGRLRDATSCLKTLLPVFRSAFADPKLLWRLGGDLFLPAGVRGSVRWDGV